MVVLGYDTTLPVTLADMVHHTRAARRGAPEAFVIADLPFLSYGRRRRRSRAPRA
jgi:3-methyl-2-oxobutanoate hydroxymethyltransferase